MVLMLIKGHFQQQKIFLLPQMMVGQEQFFRLQLHSEVHVGIVPACPTTTEDPYQQKHPQLSPNSHGAPFQVRECHRIA